ncbi:hypothetical protein [Sciscionella marina]|uniref:hypothetical protein n=1 Tax=Sciscionella marina TaxID=508770 RepID=UPI0012F657AC|nr:hypothetical protein [Sciscionella marina]
MAGIVLLQLGFGAMHYRSLLDEPIRPLPARQYRSDFPVRFMHGLSEGGSSAKRRRQRPVIKRCH